MDRVTGTIWLIVINNPTDDDRKLCKDPPKWVKKWLTQDEIAPSTGTLHVNGALKCHYTVSAKAIKDWLPRANIKKATSKEHADRIMAYGHKDDTHVEGTRNTFESEDFVRADQVCVLLAKQILVEQADFELMMKLNFDYRKLYKIAINKILKDRPDYAGRLMNPSLRNFWCDTVHTWIHHAKKEAESAQPEAEKNT